MSFAPLSPDFLRQRASALEQWFSALLPGIGGGTLQGKLLPVSGDASFRRYFRGTTAEGSRGTTAEGSQGTTSERTWILVDAPPEREDSKPFVKVVGLLAAGGVAAPKVIAADLARGFMCLEDLGDTVMWTPLDAARRDPSVVPTAAALYQSAFAELLLIQRCAAETLPPYDDALLLREMRLFTEWFCGGLMQQSLSAAEQGLLEDAYAFLAQAARAQPQVFVHRDYHSRNLMHRAGKAPGVIDFQDAVRGAFTYDLVSLLKDCYIEWPRAQVNAWALDYAAQARRAGIIGEVNAAAFLRDFDLMGAQRHIKVLGIFSRLWLRDGKRGYLRDIPLTMRYLVTVLPEHPQLAAFAAWLDKQVLPRLDDALARQQSIADKAAHGARMKAMLLAAGKGTRMLPLTATTPKPLLKVGGLTLIEHQIRKLKAAGFTEFVINHAWLGAQIESALGDGAPLGVNISWSREGEPLETAGGILRALPLLGAAPFAIVNADIWTDYPFAQLRTVLAANDLVHLALVPNPEHHPRGDFSLASGRLQLPEGTQRYTYSGIAVFHPQLFADLSDGKAPLLPLLQRAIGLGRASGEVFSGDWIDVGTPERLAALDRRLTV